MAALEARASDDLGTNGTQKAIGGGEMLDQSDASHKNLKDISMGFIQPLKNESHANPK